MPWKECSVVEERLRFVARLLDGEVMTDLCRERPVPSQYLIDFVDCHPAWRSRSDCRSEKSAGG